jgi:hypothetical protein
MLFFSRRIEDPFDVPVSEGRQSAQASLVRDRTGQK